MIDAGFFETFRTRDGVPVRLAEHLARLRLACDPSGIRIPDTFLASGAESPGWGGAIAVRLRETGFADAVFRLTLTADRSGVPRETLAARALPPEAPPEGVTLWMLTTRRAPAERIPRPKSTDRRDLDAAAGELAPLRSHPADEGLLLDADGRVCETIYANLLVRRGDTVFTPHEATGPIPGVGLAAEISRLAKQGVRVAATFFGPEALVEADAVSLVSCVRGVTPVRRLIDPAGKILRAFD